MIKGVSKLILVGLVIFILGGCITLGKSDQLSNQALRNKISALEAQLNEKDRQISGLQESLSMKAALVEQSSQDPGGVKWSNDVTQIQTALKNAGFYQDAVDGKMGRKTRTAIREFQKANNLQVDGRVGKNTAQVLKEYLNKKVK